MGKAYPIKEEIQVNLVMGHLDDSGSIIGYANHTNEYIRIIVVVGTLKT
jgi:hypothetical protein